MSASGPISNYYVDSLISHENEELLASRFPTTASHPAAARPSGLVPDCADFPSCSFAPKPAVFTTSWAPVHSQSSVGYHHPYGPQAPVGAEPRYMRTWLEPLAGAVYPGLRSRCRPPLRPQTRRLCRETSGVRPRGRARLRGLHVRGSRGAERQSSADNSFPGVRSHRFQQTQRRKARIRP